MIRARVVDAFVLWVSTGNNDIFTFIVLWFVCWVMLMWSIDRKPEGRV